MNEQNLKPLNKRTKDEQRAIQQNGGIASGEARRKNRDMKQRLLLLMDEACTADTDTTNGDMMAASLMAQAVSGDLKAVRLVGDFLGDFKQRIELEENAKITMTKDEAAAIYWAGIKNRARHIESCGKAGQGITPYEDNSVLFEAAKNELGKENAQIINDVMSYFDIDTLCDVVGDLRRWYDYGFNGQVEQAAKMDDSQGIKFLQAETLNFIENEPNYKVSTTAKRPRYFASLMALYCLGRMDEQTATL